MSIEKRGPNYKDLKKMDRTGCKIVEVNGERKAVIPLTRPIGAMVPSVGTKHVLNSRARPGRVSSTNSGLSDFSS